MATIAASAPPPHRRPTPSTLREWSTFPTVDDDVAQTRLARAMGYPPGWRVVRTLVRIPIPAILAAQIGFDGSGKHATVANADDGGSVGVLAVQDRIYAGDPQTSPDGYYNHNAALIAASKFDWRPEYDDVIHDNDDDDYDPEDYCVTSHKNKGGQLKPREAKFEVDDRVEVQYIEDEDDEDDDVEKEWYEATIVKRTEYEDDIRYTVHYHEDDAVQSNVREEFIRPAPKLKPKKKSKPKPKATLKKTPKKGPGSPKKVAESAATEDELSDEEGAMSEEDAGEDMEEVSVEEDGDEEEVEDEEEERPAKKNVKQKKTPKNKPTVKKRGRPPREVTEEQFELARDIGLPEGWSAEEKGRSKWSVRSPSGEVYKSKKAAFAAAGVDVVTGTKKRDGDSDDEDETISSMKKKAAKKKVDRPKKRKVEEIAEEEDEGSGPEESEGSDADEEDEGGSHAAALDLPDAHHIPSLEEGDPPWRTSGHRYLSRLVEWSGSPPDGSDSDTSSTGAEGPPYVGKILGWISATDVDADGNPGFNSSSTGEPAPLFHAVFKTFTQDFEEFELEGCLLPEATEEGDEARLTKKAKA